MWALGMTRRFTNLSIRLNVEISYSLILLWLFGNVCNCWLVPGSAPVDYKLHGKIQIMVNSLSSTQTQLPKRYYSLPFCDPEKVVLQEENLGQTLSGDLIEASPITVTVNDNESCKFMCKVKLTERTKNDLEYAIEENYFVRMLVDNFPVSLTPTEEHKKDVNFNDNLFLGYPIGSLRPEKDDFVHIMNNHVDFIIHYHKDDKGENFRVVGFEADPRSYSEDFIVDLADSDNTESDASDATATTSIVSTDAVEAVPSTDPSTDSSTDPAADPAKDPATDDATDPATDSPTDSARKLQVDNTERRRKMCNTEADLVLERNDEITFTYSVTWKPSEIRWATRWDNYFHMSSAGQPFSNGIHWFWIINSLSVVLFLTGIVGIILLRTLLRDIARYNQLDNIEEAQEESGWKLLHGDVFRRPRHSRLLATCAGTGVQILGMSIVTIVFAALGFLSPINRGSLLQAMILLFTFFGYPAGYVAARFAKLFDEGSSTADFKGTYRVIQVVTATALLYPGICFTCFFLLNILLRIEESVGAVPFSTLFIIIFLWFGVSVPLVCFGAHKGLKQPVISLPVTTNPIPREIPPIALISSEFVMCSVGGILPFGAVFAELLFILSSVWQHQFYTLFGFLLLILLILIVTCAEISICMTYFQLAGENYHWWWRSFWSSASAAVYVFIISTLYFFLKLKITKFVSTVLFFTYSFLLSYTFGLLTGALGFISSFFFVRAIYGSIKID